MTWGAIPVQKAVSIGRGTIGSEMKEKDEPVRVLLVEDTEDNRFMMRRLLEMSGYSVFEATNGEEAVKVARAKSPRLILMDLSLPVIDGLAATRLIRQLPACKRTPIIAVSAHDSSDFQVEAIEAGCNSYITKPIDFNELEELIAQLLDK
jgi:two-component system cell cycle response regulator DivK